MMKNFANTETFSVGEKWKKANEKERNKMISDILKKNLVFKDIEVVSVPNNGQIVLKIEKSIPAKHRGPMLLDLEEKIKASIDQGITVWCEPVGDKSVLRKLRGFEIKA